MIDNAYIMVRSGDGGNGSAAFRRAKYIPKGGPYGGDGGDGGSVWLVGTSQKSTLREFAGEKRYEAQRGENGGKNQLHGATGEDTEISIPLGTVIWEVPKEVAKRGSRYVPKPEERVLVGEITELGERIQVARGGEGGWGNVHFKSSRNTTPLEFEEGEPGEQKYIWLELKLLADVGFVGLPNAGKSTLLSVLTKARPKVADYPFTTITPNLGVIEFGSGDDRQQYVLADIPGLIEQASAGKGLGIQFLRHVERCRLLLYVLAPEAEQMMKFSQDPDAAAQMMIEQWQTVHHELKTHNPELAQKPSAVVLNKIDLFSQEIVEQVQARLQKEVPDNIFGQVPVISAATRTGLDVLQEELRSALTELPEPEVHSQMDDELPVITLKPQRGDRTKRHRILRRLKP